MLCFLEQFGFTGFTPLRCVQIVAKTSLAAAIFDLFLRPQFRLNCSIVYMTYCAPTYCVMVHVKQCSGRNETDSTLILLLLMPKGHPIEGSINLCVNIQIKPAGIT